MAGFIKEISFDHFPFPVVTIVWEESSEESVSFKTVDGREIIVPGAPGMRTTTQKIYNPSKEQVDSLFRLAQSQ